MTTSSRFSRFGIFVLALATFGLLVVLSPFTFAIFWAVVFAILFWPQQKKWASRLGGRTGAASSLIVMFILIFILAPTFFVAGLIIDDGIAIVERIQSGSVQPLEILSRLEVRFPKLAQFISSAGIDLNATKSKFSDSALSIGNFVLSNTLKIGQGASAFVFQFFILLYILFALLKNGDKIYKSFFEAIPLTNHQKETLFSTFAEMSVATLKGMVSVGLVQGLLGAGIFWILGLESPFFWGALMALLSVAPPFGAGFIWGPASVYLILSGSPMQGFVLLAFGVGIISMSDNIVRPFVVGRSSSVPSYLVLVTTLGGLAVFGLTGLILGPILTALFLSAWQLFLGPDSQERP